jgi:hypothetical protein
LGIFIHGGLFLLMQETNAGHLSKIQHENYDTLKDVLTKKGVENFQLSNSTNKSIRQWSRKRFY